MEFKRLRKLGEAIGGTFIGRISGSDPAGLAAYYQSRRIASMPLLETFPEVGDDVGAAKVESAISATPQTELDPATAIH